MLDQTLGVLVESLGEDDLSFQNLLIDGHRVLVVEGVDSSDHFVKQNTESPPVDGLSVTLVQQNLRGEVLWGSAQGVGSSFDDLRESEIDQLEVSVGGDHQVFWFEISVDNVFGVEVLEHHSNLGGIEAEK